MRANRILTLGLCLVCLLGVHPAWAQHAKRKKGKTAKGANIPVPVVRESFTAFLKMFSQDKDFQLSRIKFPLTDCYHDVPDSLNCETVDQAHWQHVILIDSSKNQGIYTTIYDNFDLELRNTDQRVFARQNIDNDIGIYYYFRNIDGLWYLVRRADYSY